MFMLNDEQVAIVTNDVENQGINFSHLGTDLIDHVCCDIEERMYDGIPFYDAYEQVKKDFGIKGLRQIQQDTLMLIDKNYRIMKNSMKLIGALSLALMAFGAMFKIMHWPMAGIMLAISFAFIALVFFPSLLYVTYKEANEKKQLPLYITGFIGGLIFITSILFKVMHWPGGAWLILSGLGILTLILIPMIIFKQVKKSKLNTSVYLIGLISLMIVLTGLLFKVMHWPGAGILLSVGGTIMILAFVPLFYITEIKNSEKPRVDFIFGIVALTFFIIFNFLLSLNASNTFNDDIAYQDNSYRETTKLLNSELDAIINDSVKNEVVSFIEQADLVCDKIEEIKILLTQYSLDISREDAKEYNKNGSPIIYGNHVPTNLLSDYNISSPLPVLKDELINLKKLYKEILPDSILISNNIDVLLNTNNSLLAFENKKLTWEEYYFSEKQSTAVMNMLSLWQYNVRLAEHKALSNLVVNSKNI